MPPFSKLLLVEQRVSLASSIALFTLSSSTPPFTTYSKCVLLNTLGSLALGSWRDGRWVGEGRTLTRSVKHRDRPKPLPPAPGHKWRPRTLSSNPLEELFRVIALRVIEQMILAVPVAQDSSYLFGKRRSGLINAFVLEPLIILLTGKKRSGTFLVYSAYNSPNLSSISLSSLTAK